MNAGHRKGAHLPTFHATARPCRTVIDSTDCRRTSPCKLRKFAADSVQPGSLPRRVAVVALFHAARPPQAVPGWNPAHVIPRRVDAVRPPGVARLGVFENAAPGAYREKGGGEATPIFAQSEPSQGRRTTAPVPAPTFTGRVRHHRVRARVQAGIAHRVPGINVRETEVDTPCLHEQSSDHVMLTVTPGTSAQRSSVAWNCARADAVHSISTRWSGRAAGSSWPGKSGTTGPAFRRSISSM